MPNNELPPPQNNETVLLIDEVLKVRKPGFRELICRVYWSKPNSSGGGDWWDGARWSSNRECKTQTVQEAIDVQFYRGESWFYIEGYNALMDKPDEPVRRSHIVNMVGPEVNVMLQVAPNNATFRARVMAVLGEMPPADATTYQQIKDWVEFNFPKEAPKKKEKEKVQVEVNGFDVERGNCKYKRRVNYRGDVTITEDDIRELISVADDIDELVDRISELIEEKAGEDREIYDTGEEETYDHEPYDGNGIDWDYRTNRIRELAIKIARQELDEDDHHDYGLS